MKDLTSLTDTALINNAKILIVDNDDSVCEALIASLHSYGVGEIIVAKNNAHAFEKIETFTPDIILLDAAHSNMEWLKFCSNLRKDKAALGDIPIVAITSMEKTDEKVKILKINVAGVLHKPIAPENLLQVLNTHLSQHHLIAKLQTTTKPSEYDLEIARDMQCSLLPDEDFLNTLRKEYRIGIHHIYKPSQALGGDYWTTKKLDNNRIMICVADFAGHGVSVALDTFRLHNYLTEFADYSHSPAQILGDMNDNFYRILPTGQYLTCFFGMIDTAKKTLTYAGASVPPAILLNGVDSIFLDCAGTPIGAYPKAEYDERIIDLRGIKGLLIYSDALIEENMEDKSLFSTDSLFQRSRDSGSNYVENIYKNISKTIKDTNHRFDDDLTLVMLDFAF